MVKILIIVIIVVFCISLLSTCTFKKTEPDKGNDKEIENNEVNEKENEKNEGELENIEALESVDETENNVESGHATNIRNSMDITIDGVFYAFPYDYKQLLKMAGPWILLNMVMKMDI